MNGRPIHQTSRSTSLFRRRGRNGGIVAQWTRPSRKTRASVLYQQFSAGTYFTIDRQQGQSQTPTQQSSTRPSTIGSRSVRDPSTFGRLDGWDKLLVESLEGRRRFQYRAAQSLLAEGVASASQFLGERVSREQATSRVAPVSGLPMTKSRQAAQTNTSLS
jgi:hypothetical protein